MIAPALILATALTAGIGTPSPSAETIYAGCRVNATDTRPPSTIRVKLHRSGRIIRVPFRLYVARVVSSEWNSVAESLQRAGAVAVKQYAWWKALHPRPSRAGCFDVHDSTADQIYRGHKTPPARVWQSVLSTWSWRIVRDGRLVHTGYRTGRATGCARDVDGYHLKARSAARCAAAGWSAGRILAVYYRGRLVRAA